METREEKEGKGELTSQILAVRRKAKGSLGGIIGDRLRKPEGGCEWRE